MDSREIYITEQDMGRLRQLLADSARNGSRSDLASLEAELRRVPPQRMTEAANVTGRLARFMAAVESGDSEMAAMTGRALERAAGALADACPGLPPAVDQLTAAAHEALA